MKKFTIFFTLLVAMATTAIADDIQVSTSTNNPEHRYTMKNGNNLFANSNTAPTQTEANYGHFAFFAVAGVENAYYIYSVKIGKYLSYQKADSYSDGMNKITLVDAKENYFYITNCTNSNLTGYYELRPYKNNGDIANLRLNWFGGVDNNTYYHYDKGTLGLYSGDGNSDQGSRYLFTDIYRPYATGERTGDKGNRKISKITLNNNDLEISEDEQTQYYVNKTDYRFTVKVEEDINISVTINTSNPWMHSYVYIDKDNNGFTATLDSNGYTPIGDLVSYSAYTTGSQYKNSKGEPVLANPTLNGIPQFKAPATPGTYRMRYKMDWNDIDPKGKQGFIDDRGFIVDFMLEVQPAVSSRTITVSTESTDCVVKANDTVGGVTADGEIVLTAEPAFGYNFVEWRLGDEVVSTDATYTDETEGDKEYVAVFERMTDEELYASIAKPTFNRDAGTAGTTIINSVKFNNSALPINNYTTNTSNCITEVLEVEAGKTYSLDLKYEMHWGDLAIFQIDKNGINKKYGYYTCEWRNGGYPVTILKDENSDLICSELGLTSIDELTYTETGKTKFLNIPYSITINENLILGDVVVIRVMIAKEGDAYNKQGYAEGSCLDIMLKVAEIDYEAALLDAFSALMDYSQAQLIGNKAGQYSTTYDYITALNEAYELLYGENPDTSLYEAKTNELRQIFNSLTLNMPRPNSYLRIQSANNYKYISSDTYTDQNGKKYLALSEATDASTILHVDTNGAICSYKNGYYVSDMAQDATNWSYLDKGVVGSTATFLEGYKVTLGERAYRMYFIEDRELYSKRDNYVDAGGTGATNENYDWYITEIDALPVAISAEHKGKFYATLFAPVAVSVPEGVNAYYLATADDIKNNIAILTHIGKVIPANTGVILEAVQAGTYNFEITETDLTVTNLFRGTVAAKYIEDDAYVLSNQNGKDLGFYKAAKNNNGTSFLSNSHKVYLPMSLTGGSAQGNNDFRIVFGGTTAIEEIEASVKNENKNEIYDLTGRKLEGFNGTGIYIVNGKKVVR